MVKKVTHKTEYATADGRTFTDGTAAEFWEKLSAAKKAHEDAKTELGRLLAESFKTADGYPFKFGGSNYYYIFKPWDAIPRILEVSFWWYHWGFDTERDNDTDMVLYAFQDGFGHERVKDPVTYPVRELYSDRRNAEAALLKAKREYVANLLEEIEEQEARHKRP